MNTLFSYNTKKVGNQYMFIVTKSVTREDQNENGQYCDSEIVKTGTYKSRAIAKNRGQKLVRYYKQLEKKAA